MPSSALLGDVIDCRAVTEKDARLKCYDRTVAAIDTAKRENKVAVVDRETVRKAKRADFGHHAKTPDPFGAKGGEELNQITTTVDGTTLDRDRRLVFTVADGSRWRQIDDRPNFAVRHGMTVTIEKASFGSYFAKFKGANSFRVRRDD